MPTTAALLFVIGLAARVCLALVFVTAAAGKLPHAAVLEGVVANYRLLPGRLVRPAARALPWAELAVGLALPAPIVGPVAVVAAIGLLLVFAWAMAVNLKRGRAHIDCGCRRPELRQPLQWSLVGRNLVLAGWLAIGLAAGLLGPATVDPTLLAVAVAAGVIAFLFYALFNALASLTALNRSLA